MSFKTRMEDPVRHTNGDRESIITTTHCKSPTTDAMGEGD